MTRVGRAATTGTCGTGGSGHRRVPDGRGDTDQREGNGPDGRAVVHGIGLKLDTRW